MTYIYKVDESLVREVVGGFLTKEWHASYFIVRKRPEGFKVVYKISESYHTLIVRDFDVDFGSKHMWCSSLNKRWQVAMAKKFGDWYLSDLKKYLYKDFDKKSEKEQKEIVGNYMEVLAKATKPVKFKNVTDKEK